MIGSSERVTPLADRRRVSGFTMVELMMTLAVLAITSTMAVAGFQILVRSQTVRNYTFELFASLALARNEAVKRNGNVTITPAAGGWQDGWQITAFDGTVLKNKTASGVTITSAPATVVYNRSGRLSAATNPFQITDKDADARQQRCVSVDLSGMPKSSNGAC